MGRLLGSFRDVVVAVDDACTIEEGSALSVEIDEAFLSQRLAMSNSDWQALNEVIQAKIRLLGSR